MRAKAGSSGSDQSLGWSALSVRGNLDKSGYWRGWFFLLLGQTFTLDTDSPSPQAMFLDVLSIVLVSPTRCFWWRNSLHRKWNVAASKRFWNSLSFLPPAILKQPAWCNSAVGFGDLRVRVLWGKIPCRAGVQFFWWLCKLKRAFPAGTVVKNPFANAGDTRDRGSIPGLGRSPAGRNGKPIQYSCLENSEDRGNAVFSVLSFHFNNICRS